MCPPLCIEYYPALAVSCLTGRQGRAPSRHCVMALRSRPTASLRRIRAAISVHQHAKSLCGQFHDDAFREKRSRHQRRAGDQAAHQCVERKRAECSKRDRFSDVDRQRSGGFGCQKSALHEAVGQEHRHGERPRRRDDPRNESDEEADDGEMPKVETEIVRGDQTTQWNHCDEESAERDLDDSGRQHEQRPRAEHGSGSAGYRISGACAPVDIAPPHDDA